MSSMSPMSPMSQKEAPPSDQPPVARRPPRRRLGLGLRLVATFVILGGGVGWALYSTAGSAFEYYKHVDEIADQLASWQDKPLQLHGFVVPGSIQKRLDRERQQLEYKFLEINCGREVEVRFLGVAPDTFKDGAEVVVKGSFTGQRFQSSEIMAKCPSKYQMTTPAQHFCARGTGN